jgi:hypothetical protein
MPAWRSTFCEHRAVHHCSYWLCQHAARLLVCCSVTVLLLMVMLPCVQSVLRPAY